MVGAVRKAQDISGRHQGCSKRGRIQKQRTACVAFPRLKCRRAALFPGSTRRGSSLLLDPQSYFQQQPSGNGCKGKGLECLFGTCATCATCAGSRGGGPAAPRPKPAPVPLVPLVPPVPLVPHEGRGPPCVLCGTDGTGHRPHARLTHKVRFQGSCCRRSACRRSVAAALGTARDAGLGQAHAQHYERDAPPHRAISSTHGRAAPRGVPTMRRATAVGAALLAVPPTTNSVCTRLLQCGFHSSARRLSGSKPHHVGHV
eukprot:gene9068-biopygen4680